MKKLQIIGIVIVAVVIGSIAWLWRDVVQHKQDEGQENQHNKWSTGAFTANENNIPPPPPKLETRFFMVYRPHFGSDTLGSITLKDSGGGHMLISTERPGDAMMFSMDGMLNGGGLSRPTVGTGEGSELRFVGTFETAQGKITGDSSGRLVFRKSGGDWAYVCGLGQYEEAGSVTRLGYDRTVASCLALLKSDDAILREGGARDLGRLCTPTDTAKVVSALIELLKDSSLPVRRGAIEALGLIGTAEAVAALQGNLAEEADKTTKEFIEEALGFCAAYTLLGNSGSAAEPTDTGLDRLLGKTNGKGKGKDEKTMKLSDWVTDNLKRSIATRPTDAVIALEKASAFTNPKVIKLTAMLKSLMRSSNEKQP